MSESENKGTSGWLIAIVAGVATFSTAFQLFHGPLVPSILWGLLSFFILMFLFSLPAGEAVEVVHTEPAPVAPVAAPVAAAPLAPATPIATVYAAPSGDGRRPERLNAPRGGKADDLTIIKGIGPKLEKLCHDLGFYHFDQLASWTSDQVIWVDVNLEGFKGRVTRDKWVGQARAIVELGPEEFLKQLADGKEF